MWLGMYGGVTAPGALIKDVDIGQVSFAVYEALEEGGKMYTFVAKTTESNYSGDLLDFVDWAASESDLSPTWCINSTKGGTHTYASQEATFAVEQFSLQENIVPSPPKTALPDIINRECTQRWGQCGGLGYTGLTCCQEGDYCAFWNDWESQCLPEYL